MAEIKPDKALADLQAKLARAKTDAEAAAIQEQIDARMAEITAEVGGGAGFGARGMVVPSKAAAGTTILEPTYQPGVFTKTTITEDRSRDPYGRAPMETKVTLYDASGKPLSAAEAARTEVGLNFAAAGRDIGFGPGFIAPGVRPDQEFATFNNVRAAMGDAAAAAGVVGGPSGSRTLVSPSGTATSTPQGTPTGTPTATAEQRSAYALLQSEFAKYGLQALVPALESLIKEGLSPEEFTIRLRETDAYKKRFAANAARIQKGLRALSEAEYIGLEDQYQDVMRRYGLPETYYTRGELGRQEGFEKFIGGDVSPVELEDRIQTAQRRVINANPEVIASLRSYYPEIGTGEVLAYFLDPNKAIEDIRRKVTAAEIGGAATQFGLGAARGRAEELATYGVTKEQAQQGFQTIAEILPRGSQLAEIYKQGPYTQTVAEQEVFGLAGATEAGKQRKKLTQLEQAAFSGQAGAAGGALARDRAGAF